MGIKDVIVSWLLRNVRIPKTEIVRIAENMDGDQDGYVDLGELVRSVKAVWRGIHG